MLDKPIQDVDDDGRFRRRLQFGIRLLIGLAILGALAWWVDMRQVLTILGRVQLWVFGIVVPVWITGIAAHVLRWRVALRSREIQVGFLYAARLILAGGFLNLFLPGAIGGDVYRIYGVRKQAAGLLQSTGVVAVERYCGFLATFLMALPALVLSRFPLEHPNLALLVVGLMLAFLLLFALGAGKSVAGWCETVLLRVKLVKLADLLSRVSRAMRSFLHTPGLLLHMIWLSVVMKIAVAVQIYFLALGLNIRLGIADLLVFLPLHTIVCALPISISGLGVREANLSAFFTQMGISPASAAGLALLVLIWLYVSSLPGAIFLLGWNRNAKTPEGIVRYAPVADADGS